jgi:DNA polymerase-3 subunit delta
MKVDLERALKHRLVLLSGDEYISRGRALQSLIEHASGGDDFDLETFIADTSPPGTWLASAGTSPFLSPRRTAVVRNVLRIDAPKDIKADTLPDTALVILVADEEGGDAERQRKFENSRKAWEKAVTSAGGQVISFRIDPKELIGAIKHEAELHGKQINDRAAETLRNMTGGSLSRAQEELEKLAIYVGHDKVIREQDVKAAAVASPEWNVFKLVDAITRGDAGETLQHIRVMVGGNNRVDDVVLRSILPTLTTQFRLIWQARICVEAKASLYALPPDLVAQFPERPNFAKEPEWKQKRILYAAQSLTFEQIAACIQAMADADARFKGLLPSFSSIDTLERLALEMISAVKKKAA